MVAPPRILHALGRELRLGGRPWLMGVVNASPDSFSGADADPVAAARSLLDAGAEIVDVGGESARTDRPPVDADEEAARVVPVVGAVLRERPDALVSVDTYKPAVARAAIEAGAALVNDVSGLREPQLADVCAATGAGLVITHTPVPPKVKGLDTEYRDVVGEVAAFMRERLELARDRGVAPEQVVLDPGPDLGKSPAVTVALLRDLAPLHALDRPLLLAVSRKDFVGALTGRRPRERLAGTLAAVAHAAGAGAHILRVHDVAAASDFLAVRAALRGEADVAPDLELSPQLRHET